MLAARTEWQLDGNLQCKKSHHVLSLSRDATSRLELRPSAASIIAHALTAGNYHVVRPSTYTMLFEPQASAYYGLQNLRYSQDSCTTLMGIQMNNQSSQLFRSRSLTSKMARCMSNMLSHSRTKARRIRRGRVCMLTERDSMGFDCLRERGPWDCSHCLGAAP